MGGEAVLKFVRLFGLSRRRRYDPRFQDLREPTTSELSRSFEFAKSDLKVKVQMQLPLAARTRVMTHAAQKLERPYSSIRAQPT